MKLYAFEQIDERLKLVPLAARRALDAARLKVPLSIWQRLEPAMRTELVELGSQAEVNVERVRELLETHVPELEPCQAFPEPRADRIPDELSGALVDGPHIADDVWAKLDAVDRYALCKVVSRGKPNRILAAFREIVGKRELSNHLDESGNVRMVDVAPKAKSARSATAESRVSMGPEAFQALALQTAPKGEVLATARLAGIMAAKRTSDLIPLCHPLSLTRCEVALTLHAQTREVKIVATVDAVDRTGVEMEAMTAASVAALTVYDMLKGLDRSMTLGPTFLLAKSGGKSGEYRR